MTEPTKPCGRCGGSGRITKALKGIGATWNYCPACNGTGEETSDDPTR